MSEVQDVDIWLPTPNGKLATGVVFKTGLVYEVAEDIDTVARALFAEVGKTMVVLHSARFADDPVIFNPDAIADIAFLDHRWIDLDMEKAMMNQRQLAALQTRKGNHRR